MHVRTIEPEDLDAILRANQSEVPAVGSVDGDRMAQLVNLAETAVVAEVHDALAGFVIALPPGTTYGSPNYRWLSGRYPDFVYVDRIVVLPSVRGRGVARRLYDEVVARTTAPMLVAEVNTRPRNEVSLRFHARYGFEEVGRAEPYDDGTQVAYLAKALPGDQRAD